MTLILERFYLLVCGHYARMDAWRDGVLVWCRHCHTWQEIAS